MTTVIEVENLSKSYGRFQAVEDVSFAVREGEIFGVLGPNGAGKTTTVECVEGLRAADGGRVEVLGIDALAHPGAVRRRIGCQLQESALPDRLRVWEALDLFAGIAGCSVDWRGLLDEWGLGGKARTPFGALSGGQRQRLFVALALVAEPEVVFLDELTQGLDPGARQVAWGLIRQVRARGTTVVLVTHYMDEAAQLCDRVAIIDGGRVTACGTPAELVEAAGLPVTVRFSCDLEDISWLARVDHVADVAREGTQVTVKGDGPVLALVAASLVERGVVPSDLRSEGATLEDAFFQLTGLSREAWTSEAVA